MRNLEIILMYSDKTWTIHKQNFGPNNLLYPNIGDEIVLEDGQGFSVLKRKIDYNTGDVQVLVEPYKHSISEYWRNYD